MTRHLSKPLVAILVLVGAPLIAPLEAAPGPAPLPPSLEVVAVEETVEGGRPTLRVTVEAVDPNGIITEVDAYWDDGTIDFAHGYSCWLDPPAPGTPHTMVLIHTYAEPGTYLAEFEAVSLSSCDASPDEPYESSEHVTLEVVWTHGGATTTTTTTTTTTPDGSTEITTTTTAGAPPTTTTTRPAPAPPAPAVSGTPRFAG